MIRNLDSCPKAPYWLLFYVASSVAGGFSLEHVIMYGLMFVARVREIFRSSIFSRANHLSQDTGGGNYRMDLPNWPAKYELSKSKQVSTHWRLRSGMGLTRPMWVVIKVLFYCCTGVILPKLSTLHKSPIKIIRLPKKKRYTYSINANHIHNSIYSTYWKVLESIVVLQQDIFIGSVGLFHGLVFLL